MKKKGSLTRYSTVAVLRIHPDDVVQLTTAAEAIAKRTVFVSYKCDDFDENTISLRLHYSKRHRLEPVPNDMMLWPDELGEQVADRIESLFA